jgi:hypothetical protein
MKLNSVNEFPASGRIYESVKRPKLEEMILVKTIQGRTCVPVSFLRRTEDKGSNVGQIKLAVAGMQAKFRQTYGREPNLLGGKAPGHSGPEALGFVATSRQGDE